MGRKPLSAEARKRQLSVALPDDLRKFVEFMADAQGRSVADEIRQRLEDSRRSEQLFDASTRWMAQEISLLARDVQTQTGHSWQQHPKSHEALAAAIATVLEQFKPKPVEGENTWGADDPVTLGRAIARARKNVREMASDMGGHIAGLRRELDEARNAFAAFGAEEADIRADIEQYRDDAKKKIEELREQFMEVLTPKQRKEFEAGLKKKRTGAGKRSPKP
jgi:hypothetical protein